MVCSKVAKVRVRVSVDLFHSVEIRAISWQRFCHGRQRNASRRIPSMNMIVDDRGQIR